jgi:hypothetical protein
MQENNDFQIFMACVCGMVLMGVMLLALVYGAA